MFNNFLDILNVGVETETDSIIRGICNIIDNASNGKLEEVIPGLYANLKYERKALTVLLTFIQVELALHTRSRVNYKDSKSVKKYQEKIYLYDIMSEQIVQILRETEPKKENL